MFCKLLNTSCLLLNYVMTLYTFLMFESCSFKPLKCFLFCHHIFHFHNMFSIYIVFSTLTLFSILGILYSSCRTLSLNLIYPAAELNYVQLMDWVHCSRKATSNPGSRKLPAFSIMYVDLLPMPASWFV